MRIRTVLFIVFLALYFGPQIMINGTIAINGFNLPVELYRFPSDIGIILLAVLYLIVDDEQKSKERHEQTTTH